MILLSGGGLGGCCSSDRDHQVLSGAGGLPVPALFHLLLLIAGCWEGVGLGSQN